MKLLSVQRARSIWLINLVDLNPHGRNVFSLIAPVIEKYKFVQFPTKPEELDLSKGINFVGGSFQKDPQNDIAIDLTIFNDGFIADTRSSTEDSDAFLDEFFSWIAEEFGLVPYKEILRSRVYVSELWVKTEKSLNALNPKLREFCEASNFINCRP